jgi:OmpA-OmpF porin, OOP family
LSDNRHGYRSVQWLFQNDKQEPAMTATRTLLCFVPALLALVVPVAAFSQTAASTDSPSFSFAGGWHAAGRSALGLTVGGSRVGAGCGTTALICDTPDRAARLYANTMIGNHWGVEVGYLDLGRIAAAGAETRAQGLNLSLVGKTPVWKSLGVFGKVGTTYGRTETSIGSAGTAYGTDQGFGLSYSAGVSFAFTPRLSATLEWESTDFRFAGGGRDPVRSTSLGLQYRY